MDEGGQGLIPQGTDQTGNVAAGERQEFVLLSDEPDWTVGDPLGFDQVAADLAAAILRSRRSTPLTLGIEGGWGSGKSTLMRKLARQLDDDPAVRTVWFNAWIAEGTSALEGLIKTVLDSIDARAVAKAARRARFVGVARALAVFAAGRFGLGKAVEAIWAHAADDARGRNQLRALMHEALDRWRDRGVRAGRQPLLVVMVDDLDRASPEQVFEIFEALKLYLDAQGLVFVVGYDQTVISEAILAEKKYGAGVTSRQYLEKIVQVGYRINPPDDDHAMALLDLYAPASGTADLFDEAARRLMIDRNDRNPRRIKRFLNTFVLLYELDPGWRELGAKCLLDVLLLDMHFREFMALFRAGTDIDPVGEFLDYRRQWVEIDKPGSTFEGRANDRGRLERTLPVLYPTLVDNDEFVALVESLQTTERWPDVRLKLQARRSLAVQLPSQAAEVDADSFRPPSVGRILWLTDDVSSEEWLTVSKPTLDSLRGSGWVWRRVGREQFAETLSPHALESVDVVVVDGSAIRIDAPVLPLLTRFRDEDMVDAARPVVLFTPRITPSLREWADTYRFAVVGTAGELRIWLDALYTINFDVNMTPHSSSHPEPTTKAPRK